MIAIAIIVKMNSIINSHAAMNATNVMIKIRKGRKVHNDLSGFPAAY